MRWRDEVEKDLEKERSTGGAELGKGTPTPNKIEIRRVNEEEDYNVYKEPVLSTNILKCGECVWNTSSKNPI